MSVATMGSVVIDRPSASVLPGLLGFFFSFRLILILLSVRAFLADPQLGVEISIAFNLLFLAVVIFHSMGPAALTFRTLNQITCFRWVLVFVGFSLCSLIWTAAVSVPAAAAYWSAMASDVFCVVLLLRTDSEESVTSSLMAGYVAGACGVALIAWILPAEYDLRLGDEELLGPNQIGFACAFALFLAQYLINNGRKIWKLPAAFLAITLLRSLSKTTIIAFVVAEAFILAKDATISKRTKVMLWVGAGLVIAAFWNLLGDYYEVYTNAGNQSETLTGRIGIWAVILDLAFEHPWIGHGFHSVWKVVPSFGDFEPRHAHNELLQQFYTYGVAGVLMLVMLYTSFYRQIRKLPSSPTRTLFLGMLIFVIVRGLADTEVFDLSLPLWFLALISLSLAAPQLRAREGRL
jgi:exopolysaccharide production protein ExoQ